MAKWLEEFADNNEDEEVVATTLGKIFLFGVVWMFIGAVSVILHGLAGLINWLLAAGFYVQMMYIFILPGFLTWAMTLLAVIPSGGPQFVKKCKIKNKEIE